MSYRKVRQVVPLEGYKLSLTFNDGEIRTFDVGPYLDHGVFKELRDTTMFKTVRVSFDTVEWANGADICPEVLYEESVVVRKVAEDSPSYGE